MTRSKLRVIFLTPVLQAVRVRPSLLGEARFSQLLDRGIDDGISVLVAGRQVCRLAAGLSFADAGSRHKKASQFGHDRVYVIVTQRQSGVRFPPPPIYWVHMTYIRLTYFKCRHNGSGDSNVLHNSCAANTPPVHPTEIT